MALIGVLVGMLGLVLLWVLLRRKKAKPRIRTATCPVCGWRGQVNRHAGSCPACSAPLGDQKGGAVIGNCRKPGKRIITAVINEVRTPDMAIIRSMRRGGVRASMTRIVRRPGAALCAAAGR